MANVLDRRRRRSIRLQGYDYSQAGAYFVTVCTPYRRCLFGDVVDGRVVLTRYGRIAAECWEWLGARDPHVQLDEWIVMPNHLHGIIVMSDDNLAGKGGSRTAPTVTIARKPLGRLVGAFKTVSAKRINSSRGTPGARFWQRNYYEHVIRSEDELQRVREYIAGNPGKWMEDPENPRRIDSERGRRGGVG